MPELQSFRRLRRDPRYKAPKKRKRRNLEKFVPRADSDFATTANDFANHIAQHAEECFVPQDRVELLVQRVADYRTKLAAAMHRRTRTQQTIAEKNTARKAAEEIVREVANMIRGNKSVDDSHRRTLRIKDRPKKLKKRKCPDYPPELQFIGSGDGVSQAAGVGNGSGVHVLKFWNNEPPVIGRSYGAKRKSRPDGATRLELFVDLVPVGQPVPKSPLDRVREGRGFPWYLRSFTKNPIEVEFPLPATPMLVVYWARWADSSGEVSRWSVTCKARIEGYTSQMPADALPAADATPVRVIEPAALPDHSTVYRIEEPKQLPAAQQGMLMHASREQCVILRLPEGE